MRLISIWTPKGGSGKSTITLNLAACIAEHGHSVGIVDADKQRTLLKIHADGHIPFSIVGLDKEITGKALKEVTQFDYILVDFAPGVGFQHEDGTVRAMDTGYEKRMRGILEASDIVVSPLTPSRADYQALAEGVEDVKLKRHFLVANRIDHRLGEDREFLALLTQQGAQYSIVSARSVFRRSFNAGMSVFRDGDKLMSLYGAQEARREITYLFNQIEGAL
jgi:chromosome partitioning protein